jgi:hypothetical protein
VSNLQKQKTGAYSRKCQTATATPAKPGVLLFGIDSIAWPIVDAQLADSFSGGANITRITEGQSPCPAGDFGLCPGISKLPQPSRKRLRPSNFDHQKYCSPQATSCPCLLRSLSGIGFRTGYLNGHISSDLVPRVTRVFSTTRRIYVYQNSAKGPGIDAGDG